MMKLEDIYAEKEAAKFLLDKVGDPYIARYVNQSRQARAQGKDHSPLFQTIGATAAAEAFFEAKMYTANKSRYGHNHKKTGPVDRRATLIT